MDRALFYIGLLIFGFNLITHTFYSIFSVIMVRWEGYSFLEAYALTSALMIAGIGLKLFHPKTADSESQENK